MTLPRDPDSRRLPGGDRDGGYGGYRSRFTDRRLLRSWRCCSSGIPLPPSATTSCACTPPSRRWPTSSSRLGSCGGWSSGVGIRVFQLAIASPFPPSPQVFEIAKASHDLGATILVWGVLLHVAGVLKHMFVDRDHLLNRIMVPPRRSGDSSAP